MKKLAKQREEELEDKLDVMVAEARRGDEKITIEELEKQLTKAGKLQKKKIGLTAKNRAENPKIFR